MPHYYNDYLLARCLDQAAATGWVVRTNPFEGGSDHTPFLQFKKPGALFWHFTDVYYHTDGDRIDKVSKSELVNVGNAALASVLTLDVGRRRHGARARRRARARRDRAARHRVDAEQGGARGGRQSRRRRRTFSRRGPTTTSPSLHTMTDIEVGGSSRETLAAIDAAATRVKQAGDQRLASLAR